MNKIETIMTRELITVNPEAPLNEAKEIFDKHRIHHIPVVRYRKIVGLLSKTDMLYFLKGANCDGYEKILNEARLRNYRIEEIMVTGLATLAPDDRIATAVEVFKENLFHAIPIVKDEELVGILTTYDIINALSIAHA